MSDQSLAERLSAEIRSQQNTYNTLQSAARLTELRDEVGTLESTTSGLGQSVADLRMRGYVFERSMEEKGASLAHRWSAMSTSVQQQINQQAIWLQMELRPVDTLMVQLLASESSPDTAQPLLAQAKAAMSALQAQVDGAESSIRSMYDDLQQEGRSFTARVQQIQWLLTQLAEASFPLLAGESAIAGVKATWVQRDKEDKSDPKGVLLLTDQRLLFEQKQEIATRKVLFITTEKQKVQKLLLSLNVADIGNATASKQGLFGHEDHLWVEMAHPAAVHSGHFHLDGQDCDVWQGLVSRAKSRDFDRERTDSPQAETIKVPVLPDRCPGCGGAITQPATRGMEMITCAYCGRVIRL